MPVFDKKAYWKRRNAKDPADRQAPKPQLAKMFKYTAPKEGKPRAWRRQGMRVTVIPVYSLCAEDKCMNSADRDGMCKDHWSFYFAGLTNHQRMAAKKQLREFREKVADAPATSSR